ncbi:MAG: hypothetical protein ACJAYK_001824 [Crocinitomicaceae bacterium]|jgi:hypothetical protein
MCKRAILLLSVMYPQLYVSSMGQWAFLKALS